jgi:hypothetical protein
MKKFKGLPGKVTKIKILKEKGLKIGRLLTIEKPMKKHKHIWLNNRFGGFGKPPISVCKKCKLCKILMTLEDYKNKHLSRQ